MNFLVIDGTQDKIKFFSYYNNNSYHKYFEASKNNNEKFSLLLFNFLNKSKININKLDNILINQGPGKFSGIRISLAAVKGLSFANKIDVYGFNSDQIINKNYVKIVELFNKGLLKKNLNKPNYSS